MKKEDVKEGARVICVWQGRGKAYFGQRGTITKVHIHEGKLSSYWVADDTGKWISGVGWGDPESFELVADCFDLSPSELLMEVL